MDLELMNAIVKKYEGGVSLHEIREHLLANVHNLSLRTTALWDHSQQKVQRISRTKGSWKKKPVQSRPQRSTLYLFGKVVYRR